MAAFLLTASVEALSTQIVSMFSQPYKSAREFGAVNNSFLISQRPDLPSIPVTVTCHLYAFLVCMYRLMSFSNVMLKAECSKKGPDDAEASGDIATSARDGAHCPIQCRAA